MTELVIDDSNFDQYFFDVRKHKPMPGQVMACYTAMAELVKSNEKQQIIDLLKNTDKMEAALQVMRKLFFVSEEDSYKILLEMSEDLLDLIEEDVLDKPYKYKMEMFFYTNKEYVPKNDSHWSFVSLININDKIPMELNNSIDTNLNNETTK